MYSEKLIKTETSQANKIMRSTKASNKEVIEYDNSQYNEDDFEKSSCKYEDFLGNDKLERHVNEDDTGEVVISDDEIFYENEDNFEDEDDEDEDDSITDSMSQ